MRQVGTQFDGFAQTHEDSHYNCFKTELSRWW